MKKSVIIFLLTLSLILTACKSFDKTPADQPTKATTEKSSSITDSQKNDYFIVDEPKANSKVFSPVEIKGKARGNMFFEASFGIDITDANGLVLGSGTATATDNWMTEDFVPFTATIYRAKSGMEKGYIVLKKDNPSGLPENDLSIKIPVQF